MPGGGGCLTEPTFYLRADVGRASVAPPGIRYKGWRVPSARRLRRPVRLLLSCSSCWDHLLWLAGINPFAECGITQLSASVENVMRRPVLIAEGVQMAYSLSATTG